MVTYHLILKKKASETVKQQQEETRNLNKDDILVNSQNLQENFHQAPKESFNEVLKSVDKEKGVLVGSLSVGAKLNDPSNLKIKESSPDLQNVDPNKMQNIDQGVVPDNVQHQVENQSHVKSDVPNSNKIVEQNDAFKQIGQKLDAKPEIKNPPAVQQLSISPSPVSPKKIEPEKAQKEKIDREI